MSITTESEYRHVGESCGLADHDHDLVHDLNRRLDALWRYDQYIANADWRTDMRRCWEELKAQDQQAVARLRALIATEVRNGCF